MKLTKLHLYGFGRFQDFQINLSTEPIHIFLGENEAGKSTIMAFIRCILFGFPTKQQSELRYEPRLGGRYGGNIVLETARFGKVTIERVHGKATGDVKVYFPDGSIGGEAELKHVLSEIDRTTFSAIYSFGLTDLQTMEQLHSDELNKFMYGVGISGRNNLLEIEKKNEKIIQNLYKPTGRKPIINEQLKKVVSQEEKLNAWRQKLSQHDQLVIERTSIINLIEKGSNEEGELNRRYRYFEKLQTIAPVILNKKIAENRLAQLPAYDPFPEDGLLRLEKLTDSFVLVEGEVIDLERKFQTIEREIGLLPINENITNLEETIGQIKESRKVYETKRDEKVLLFQQIKFEEHELEMMQEKLGYNNVTFETSFVTEQKLTSLIEQEMKLKQQEYSLKSQLDQLRTSLENKEKEVESLHEELLDENTKLQLEESVKSQSSEKELHVQLKYVDDRFQLITSQLKQFGSTKSNLKNLLFLASVLLSFLGAFFLLQNAQQFLAFLLVIVTLIIIGFLKWESKNTHKTVIADLEKQKEKLSMERQEILAKLQIRENNNQTANINLLQKDQQKREHLFFKKQSLQEVNEQYEHICQELDKWDYMNASFQEALQSWATEGKYPLNLEAQHYLKLLQVMEEIKQKQRQLTYLNEKLVILDNEVKEFENKVDNLCRKNSLSSDSKNYLQMIERLSLFLKKEQETEAQLNRLLDQQKQLVENIESTKIKHGQIRNEIEKLFQMANVETEEEFRQKGKAWLESQQIKEQLRGYNSQLSPIVESEADLKQIEKDVIQYKDLFDEKLEQLEKQINEIRSIGKIQQEKLAKKNQDIKELEEGDSYSSSLHNFENEKGILNAEVKKWAFHRTVQLLIDEAKKVYEKERQPHVIKEATRMFRFMTNGKYVQLFAPINEQRLFVERSDSLRFQPNELSQGTKEQLYLAIRLALATVHSKQTPFPIFIDDIFVNFDAKRRLKAMELLKEMSNQHQIIFFTCHPFMAEEISKEYYSLEVTHSHLSL